MLLDTILNIFKNECTYEAINKMSDIKLRNIKSGVNLLDAIYYKFSYAKKENTKEKIVSSINYKNKTTLSRQAFEKKENNISLKMYNSILCKLKECYTDNFIEGILKLVGIDGTYNNDNERNELLNMGFYDITNGIPIELKSFGKENKNKEIKSATDYIKANLDIFKNTIIVGDRGYFSYAFLNFLIVNDLKFIIRIKGNAEKFNPNYKLSPKTKGYKAIKNAIDNTRIIKYENIFHKTIYTTNSKKYIENHSVDIKNNCIISTNLTDVNTYSDDKIMELYKSRWDIEVFFKYIKANFKFQHMDEKSSTNYNKMYVCDLIITMIAKLLEKYYISKHCMKIKEGMTYKINKSNLVNGIFDNILYDIIHGTLTENDLDAFCESNIIIIQNKTNRSFPRTAKTPFKKWYVKGYSNLTRFMRIIDAILNNTVDKLPKNLKTIAKTLISIDGEKCT